MPAMQPGSGGPYADQKNLRFQIREVKNDLAMKPMKPRERKSTERWLATLQARLRAVNAEIRERKKSRARP